MVYGYTRSTMDAIPMDINGEFSCYYRSDWANMGIYQAGVLSRENQVCFNVWDFEVDAEQLDGQMQSVFYKLNMDVFEQVIERLRNGAFEPEVFEDGHVSGNYYAEEAGWLMLTIPNEENWTVTVNGAEVQAEDGVNLFMTIPVQAGENRVELRYHVKGISAGIAVSIASVIIFAALSVADHRKRKII